MPEVDQFLVDMKTFVDEFVATTFVLEVTKDQFQAEESYADDYDVKNPEHAPEWVKTVLDQNVKHYKYKSVNWQNAAAHYARVHAYTSYHVLNWPEDPFARGAYRLLPAAIN